MSPDLSAPPPSCCQVINNCVCAPDQSLNTVSAFAVAPLRQSLHPEQPPAPPHNRVLAHMWQTVQNNNGIKVSAWRSPPPLQLVSSNGT